MEVAWNLLELKAIQLQQIYRELYDMMLDDEYNVEDLCVKCVTSDEYKPLVTRSKRMVSKILQSKGSYSTLADGKSNKQRMKLQHTQN